MNNFTESTWAVVGVNEATQKLMKTYIEYPPRKLQSESYTGPITLSRYFQYKEVQEQLKNDGISLPWPAGN